MGAHSGYDLLCRALGRRSDIDGDSVWRTRTRKPEPARSLLHWIVRHARGTPLYDESSAAAELRAFVRGSMGRFDLCHVLYAEENYALFGRLHRLQRTPLIATAHQPPDWWLHSGTNADALRAVRALIVMSRAQEAFFAKRLRCPVRFIPHGVDTEFFSPTANQSSAPSVTRFLSCGVWLRDLDTLERVIEVVLRRDPGIAFDLVMPAHVGETSVLERLRRRPQVAWHLGLDDEALRALYRRARALVLPMRDCTANNAVLEAMACGLPIVSNRVGGMPDYTTPDFADLLPPGDVDGFAACLDRLLAEPALWRTRATAARRHAVEHLGWDKQAEATLALCREALGERG
jgi:glycosyltransferase involved in cell wall biosynthesis